MLINRLAKLGARLCTSLVPKREADSDGRITQAASHIPTIDPTTTPTSLAFWQVTRLSHHGSFILTNRLPNRTCPSCVQCADFSWATEANSRLEYPPENPTRALKESYRVHNPNATHDGSLAGFWMLQRSGSTGSEEAKKKQESGLVVRRRDRSE